MALNKGSTESKPGFTARQFGASMMLPIDMGLFGTAGTFENVKLPEGAVITGGFLMVQVANDASAITVTVEDNTGTQTDALVAGDAAAVAKTDVTVSGEKLLTESTVKIVTAADLTLEAGVAFLYLDYVVEGRSHFSEGK